MCRGASCNSAAYYWNVISGPMYRPVQCGPMYRPVQCGPMYRPVLCGPKYRLGILIVDYIQFFQFE